MESCISIDGNEVAAFPNLSNFLDQRILRKDIILQPIDLASEVVNGTAELYDPTACFFGKLTEGSHEILIVDLLNDQILSFDDRLGVFPPSPSRKEEQMGVVFNDLLQQKGTCIPEGNQVHFEDSASFAEFPVLLGYIS